MTRLGGWVGILMQTRGSGSLWDFVFASLPESWYLPGMSSSYNLWDFRMERETDCRLLLWQDHFSLATQQLLPESWTTPFRGCRTKPPLKFRGESLHVPKPSPWVTQHPAERQQWVELEVMPGPTPCSQCRLSSTHSTDIFPGHKISCPHRQEVPVSIRSAVCKVPD